MMGVAGSGKSLIGSLLAEKIDAVFEDADDFHPPANKAKMTAKIPLTDEDRWPWLNNLRERIEEIQAQGRNYIVACSALKDVYRQLLRGQDDEATLKFVYLKGSKELIAERMAARKGHFMPTSLLDSQFATLEEPDESQALVVDVSGTPEEIVEAILQKLK